MTEKEYALSFYTAEYDESGIGGDTFGCASLGLATDAEWILPGDREIRTFPKKIRGILINGDLGTAYEEIEKVSADVKAGIVFFGNCGGENGFMKALSSRFPGVPFAGGSPAIGSDGRTGRMLPENGQAAVLLITDGRYDISAETLNVYGEILFRAKVAEGDVRSVSTVTVDGEKTDFYGLIQKAGEMKGVTGGLTERVSVSDMTGRNIHLIEDSGKYVCGTDLPSDGRLLIRYTDRENVIKSMEDFYSTPDSLVFGCAGVKSNLGDSSFHAGAGSLGMFMFGEVVSITGAQPDFANLMLTKLIFTEK